MQYVSTISPQTQKDISQLYNALTYLDFRDPHGGDLTDYDTWTTPPPGNKKMIIFRDKVGM